MSILQNPCWAADRAQIIPAPSPLGSKRLGLSGKWGLLFVCLISAWWVTAPPVEWGCGACQWQIYFVKSAQEVQQPSYYPAFISPQSKLNLRPAGLFSCWILWPIFCKTSLEIGWLMSHFRRIDTGAASLGNTRARRRYQSFTHFTSSSACFSCLELLLTQTRKFSKLHSAGWNISVSTGIFKVLSPVFVMLSCLWFNKVELWSEGFSWGSGIH